MLQSMGVTKSQTQLNLMAEQQQEALDCLELFQFQQCKCSIFQKSLSPRQRVCCPTTVTLT